MKIPKIDPRTRRPQIQLGNVELDIKGDFREKILAMLRPSSRELENNRQLREYFAHLFGFEIFEQSKIRNDVWVYNFVVTGIDNDNGDSLVSGPDLGLIISVVLLAFRRPSGSVNLEGQLVDANTGCVLSEDKLTEKFTSKRSFFSDPIKSLHMIEFAAIKLLTHLKQDAEANYHAAL